MGYLKVSDDLIWVRHIEGDKALTERLIELPAGSPIDLEVDGIVGQWEKARTGKDGRATDAVKPVGPMKEIWKTFQKQRGKIVTVRETRTADSYLAAMSATLSEWDSKEDDEAFRDL